MTEIQRRLQRLEGVKRAEKEALAVLDTLDVKPHIAPVYYELHEDLQRGEHKVFNLPGGRGSAKSSFASLEIVDGIMRDPTGHTNAIVFRLYGNTLRDSVYAQISWAIDTLDVDHLWEPKLTPMQFTFKPTGATIYFRGLDDVGKLKSIKPAKGTFRYIWFEEFSELPGPNFVRSIMQSVMRGQGPNAIVFRTFNPPISSNNWANKHIQEPDKRAVTLLTNYTQIPPEWLGEDFLYEAERLRELNPKAYEHEYLGQPVGAGGEVFPGIEVRTITDEEIEQMEYFYNGLDFGFAVDPACFMRVSYDRKHDTVYLIDEIYKKHCSNRQMSDFIKEKGYDKTGKIGYVGLYTGFAAEGRQLLICDAAEPKSINDLQSEGINAVACHKFAGCVEYRTKWLQHRKLVIDPARTPEAFREFTEYEYETDKDGNFLSVLPDRNNHSIDSVAYALDRVIYTKGRKGVSA